MNLREVDLRDIYKRWKSNLGLFRCFFRSTAFVSLQTYDDFQIEDYSVNENEESILLNKVLEQKKDDCFIIVDLELDEILRLGVQLNNYHHLKPILNVNLMFHPFGLIGDKDNISSLINCGLNLEKIKPEGFVMLIPYDRYNEEIDYKEIDDKLNNQYALGDDDLPSIEFFKQCGYKSINIITRKKVKEDLNDYINYVNKGIEVNLIEVE